ncbi:MAG: malonate decarboxylase holo-[acyl-carrier-protein] synthase [Desulfuromonadales bacterium]
MAQNPLIRTAFRPEQIRKRHTLLEITDAGRKTIIDELAENDGISAELLEKITLLLLPENPGFRTPGIVRREETDLRAGYIPIGFSAPVAGEDGRLRVAAFVACKDVERAISPYDVLKMSFSDRTASMRALFGAVELAGELGLKPGIWGSAALELYTGLPCTHDESDLDLLVETAPLETLSRFLEGIRTLEERFGLRIDVEVDLSDGYGVQLKELLGRGSMVLGKSINGVSLFPREHLLAALPH